MKQIRYVELNNSNRLLKFIEEQVNLPDYLINSIDIDHTVLNGDQIEKIADDFRKQFDLGLAPISNLTNFVKILE